MMFRWVVHFPKSFLVFFFFWVKVRSRSRAGIVIVECRSTKGASKQRRDLINVEILQLRDLLPLSDAARQRLSQLQIMSLACCYIRKNTCLSKREFLPNQSYPFPHKFIHIFFLHTCKIRVIASVFLHAWDVVAYLIFLTFHNNHKQLVRITVLSLLSL